MSPPIRVAIVGAGPGGLAAAILLGQVEGVEVALYDKARELREVGAGIALNQNTWRLLKVLGADQALAEFVTQPDPAAVTVEHRNGLTGALLSRKYQSAEETGPPGVRIERYKLQNALLSRLPTGFPRLNHALTSVEPDEQDPRLSWLQFADGAKEGPFDVIVGADGLRSVVRQQIFPEHRISYTGKVAFRRLIPEAEVAHISGIPRSSCFWHGPTTHVYTNYLPGGLFEIATRAVEGPEYGEKVSWGRKIDTARVVPHYEAFNETIRQIIAVPEDYLEFAMYGGPLLRRVIANGNIAVLGDASHPLSGAFGSGAAFAFEDAFVLSRALDRAQRQGQSIADALEVYDAIRAPRYQDLFKVLDTMAANAKHVASEIPASEPNARIEAATQLNWQLENGWIYAYNIEAVWSEYERRMDLLAEDSRTLPVEVKQIAAPAAGILASA